MNSTSFTLLLPICLTAIVMQAGCDSTELDPFQNDNRYYTLYGFLDQTTNFEPGATHAIRITPITRRAERIESPDDPQAFIDARVFTIDQQTQQEVEWRHDLTRFPDGSYGHIFWSRLFVQPNRTYRLEVRRSDGIVTSAETTVPAVASGRTERSDPVIGSDGITQEVTIQGIEAIWDISVIYRLGGESCTGSTRYSVPYGRAQVETTDGWTVTIDLSGDKQFLDEQFGTSNAIFCSIGVEARVVDVLWDLPPAEVDLEALTFTNTLSNVVNGFGFFGSIGLFQDEWAVDDAVQDLLGQ